MTEGDARRDIQAAQYGFPYHWLPHTSSDGAWRVARSLDWGFEYLGLLSAMVERVLMAQPERVLDFGGGDARLTAELLRLGVPAVDCVDHDARALALGRALVGDAVGAVRWLDSVPDDERGSYDAVVAMEVLEHVPDGDMEGVLSTLRAALATDGVMHVSVPTTNLALSPKHERHYTADLLRAAVDPWFSVEDVSYIHRLGAEARAVRTLTTNRLFILRHDRLLRALRYWYRKRIYDASAATGSRMLATLVPSRSQR